MTGRTKLLVLWSLCYLACATAGTALAIARHLPARFGGILNGNDVAMDFLTLNGTALSAPLFMLLAQVTFTAVALRPGPARKVGIVGLTVLGVLYFLGQLGEPILVETFNAAQAIILLGSLLFAGLMVVFGTVAWRELPTILPASR